MPSGLFLGPPTVRRGWLLVTWPAPLFGSSLSLSGSYRGVIGRENRGTLGEIVLGERYDGSGGSLELFCLCNDRVFHMLRAILSDIQ